MIRINENYLKLPGNYLFAEIRNRVNAFKDANPDADVISFAFVEYLNGTSSSLLVRRVSMNQALFIIRWNKN